MTVEKQYTEKMHDILIYVLVNNKIRKELERAIVLFHLNNLVYDFLPLSRLLYYLLFILNNVTKSISKRYDEIKKL